jgi:apolipoprotein N-acyltransferase
VDAAGLVRMRASTLSASTVSAVPSLLDAPRTFYARFGDAPWAILALVLANVAVWRAARRRRAPTTG